MQQLQFDSIGFTACIFYRFKHHFFRFVRKSQNNVCNYIDSDVNFMDVGSCTASCIRIYKNASGTVSGGSSSSSNKNSTQATGKGGKSKHPTEPTTVNASNDEYIDYNPIKDKQIKFFLAGMGITAGCLAILAVAYAIGKKSAQKKAEKEKNHNDNTLENKTSDD